MSRFISLSSTSRMRGISQLARGYTAPPPLPSLDGLGLPRSRDTRTSRCVELEAVFERGARVRAPETISHLVGAAARALRSSSLLRAHFFAGRGLRPRGGVAALGESVSAAVFGAASLASPGQVCSASRF